MAKAQKFQPRNALGRFASPAGPQAGYDITDPKKRREQRTSRIEYGNEESIRNLPPHKRLKSINALRNLIRNYTQAKSLLKQFRFHVIGQKVMFHTENAVWNEKADHYFNSRFAKHADGRDDRHLDDLNAMMLLSVIREHDCLAFFDSAGLIPGGKGRIFTWEADQICNIAVSDWKCKQDQIQKALGAGKKEKLIQNTGVIKNQYGIIRGYVAHSKNGKTTIPLKDATIIPRGPGRLLKEPWRLNQDRGLSDLLASAKSLTDNYEILMAELQSAKASAHLAISMTKQDSLNVAQGRADSSETSDKPGLESEDVIWPRNYKNFEKLSGGALEYLEPGEKAEILENKRPAAQLEAFLQFQAIQAGASMGLPRFYSLMQANASYSATRAEINLGEVTFKYWQKWLERYVLDWEVRNAIIYAFAIGALDHKERPDWDEKYSFTHPEQKPIDPVRAAKADSERLRNGTATLQSVLGPRWKETVKQRGEELKFMEEQGVPPPPSGAPARALLTDLIQECMEDEE